MMYGPVSLTRSLTISWSWSNVIVESAVFTVVERAARLTVPRPDKTENGGPDNHVRIPLTRQPLINLLSPPSPALNRWPWPKGSSYTAFVLNACVMSNGGRL